jgi:6-phosphogluconolactonase/glucosamine-6-phosphate isomerase/deaminase
MLRFIKVESPEPVVSYLAEALAKHLDAGERVVWLVSGGSAIKVAVEVAHRLRSESLENLSVTLADERPGPVGHADSNMHQLELAGFSLPGAHLVPVLTGASTAADTAAFARFLKTQLKRNQYRIGLFGIGPDGHTAGIPARDAASSTELAASYEARDFRRISMTPAAISRLDEVVAYAMGDNKQLALARLAADLQITEQSAQAVKQAKKVTIFNDYKGESA